MIKDFSSTGLPKHQVRLENGLEVRLEINLEINGSDQLQKNQREREMGKDRFRIASTVGLLVQQYMIVQSSFYQLLKELLFSHRTFVL